MEMHTYHPGCPHPILRMVDGFGPGLVVSLSPWDHILDQWGRAGQAGKAAFRVRCNEKRLLPTS